MESESAPPEPRSKGPSDSATPTAAASHNEEASANREKGGGGTRRRIVANRVRKIRTEKMLSKAELARRAGMSTLTIDRVERGMPCRMDTKRKIIEALGLGPSDRVMVFGEDD